MLSTTEGGCAKGMGIHGIIAIRWGRSIPVGGGLD